MKKEKEGQEEGRARGTVEGGGGWEEGWKGRGSESEGREG